MAARFGLAGGIPERRVRPIWDAIDSRQFKASLKLANGLLAKYPTSPYALALKALILERMGKPEEALGICLEAKELLHSNNSVHVDYLTLSTLQIVFQRLDHLELATLCYEHACVKYPNNLEIMIGLFNCYVRECSYVKQQQLAMKMYKLVGEERFLLWAVCSIQLQVHCSSTSQKLLQLAEALMKKHMASNSLHDPEALVLYLSLLEQQEKFDAAVEVLSGDLGSLIGIQEDKLRIQGRLLARACNYSAATEIFERVLVSCPDDWEVFLCYLGCLLEDDLNWLKMDATMQICSPSFDDNGACKANHLSNDEFNSRISSAVSLVQRLQTDCNGGFVRGAFLANIEIERRCRLCGTKHDDNFVEALLTYFYRFGHLSCFASDVENFLHLLTLEEKDKFLEKLMKTLESPPASPLKALDQAISIFKVHESLGVMFSLPLTDLEVTTKRMLQMYCKNLTLSKDLDPQENMHGEELLSMISNILVVLFWRTRILGYLLEAIMVLEYGLTIRRYVWQYKIQLVHLYSLLGALPLAYEWYCMLEVKNILVETVSHHILPQMLNSPLWSETGDLLSDYLKFMDDHLRESADLTSVAYRHRNYSKVIEFVQFKERLGHSSRLLTARLDVPILQLKQKANSLEEVECIFENLNCGSKLLEMSNEDKMKILTFNEDFHARPWWSPTPNINYLADNFEEGFPWLKEKLNKKKKAVEEEGIVKKLIERKSLLPRLIYLSIQISPISLKGNVGNGSLHDADAIKEIKSLLEKYARNIGLSFDDAMSLLLAIFKGQKPLKDLGPDIISWLNFTVFVNAWNLCCHQLESPRKDSSMNSWSVVDYMLRSCISEQLTHPETVLAVPGSNLPVLVQLVAEPLAWHILVIQSCIRSMLPAGKKKKKTGLVDSLNSSYAHAVCDSVQCLISVLQDIGKWVSNQIRKSEDQDVDRLLSHLQRSSSQEELGSILSILEASESMSVSEVGERISAALQSWSAATVCRKISAAQHSLLSQFLSICESKLKLLYSINKSI
ncbi:N-terminal acetyltransferase B complex auxiliary subunit NAA25-like isoform X1 [Zingiber officinale]|uniref:N-terminal acetyltransferase B complex auxiliary subunit NAA25-like isoform X1 n=2 Tax=Zingiber officinale TaxID=94328 RepID=UPI001C4AC807|nr:N-terminal acetyltransferase B complex auxiliary subunit NAA25-like isoform X1 [Zingiber officinale]